MPTPDDNMDSEEETLVYVNEDPEDSPLQYASHKLHDAENAHGHRHSIEDNELNEEEVPLFVKARNESKR